MAALEVSGLHAHYGKAHVLQGIDLSLPEGSVAGVFGRNGAGKTTLLRAIMGLGARTSGEIRLFGAALHGLPTDRRARSGLALMSQDMRVFPDMSVLDNIRVASGAVADPAPLDEIVGLIPELRDHLGRPAGRLSGGQKQLVALARSLTTRCRVLLMDEPTEGLMPSIVARIGEVIAALAARSVTVLLVEQNVQLGLATCTDIHFIEKGRLVGRGTPGTVVSGGLLERFLGVRADGVH